MSHNLCIQEQEQTWGQTWENTENCPQNSLITRTIIGNVVLVLRYSNKHNKTDTK